MPLSAGTRLGPYEILAALGAGGMGEVYRARDTKLNRDVAIKVLPEAVAADANRIARLEREAKALAALNHPQIATLHALEQFEGRHFLVMELVDGETLADRLRRGPLTVEDALRVGIQIAEALEAAHEKGVVHRDLKPANVKITTDEKVKVLDFGLARLGAGEAGGAVGNATHSPTLSLLATEAGLILGTAAYMSPEQARGLQADHRSDVFSFGVVLYEMLTGRQPFQGETAPDIMASVLAREPDLNALPINLNPRISELLKRCLDKNPRKRWQAVGDLRVELEVIAANPRPLPADTTVTVRTQPLWKRAVPIAITGLLAIAATSAAWWYFRPPAAARPVTRFTFTLPEGQLVVQNGTQLLAISPDGSQMVYVANRRLNLRSMSELEIRPLAAGEMAAENINGSPVFSPDGGSIAFWVGSGPDAGMIKRVSVAGGAAVTICQAGFPLGMNWGPDGIVFGQLDKGVLRASPNGGQPELLVSVKDAVAWGPQILPDGDTLLFTLATTIKTLSGATTESWDKAQIVVQSLKTGARRTLIEGGLGARYLPTGHIVYVRGGVLLAVPFDRRRLEVTGGPVAIVEGVRRPVFFGSAPGTVYYSVSDNGSLIYMPGPASMSSGSPQTELLIIDRQGTAQRLKLSPAGYSSPRVSPDGKRLAVLVDDGRNANVFMYDLSGASALRQLTFGGRNRSPVWSPDGRYVAFQSDREGDSAIFRQLADGTGTAERLTKPDPKVSHIPDSWSPDGKTILYEEFKDSRNALWTLSVPERKVGRIADIESPGLLNAIFSHDGRWIAYNTNLDAASVGQTAVFVEPFPATGAKSRIGRGFYPLWSLDGHELSYLFGQQLQTVSIGTQAGVTFGSPAPLSTTATFIYSPSTPRVYDITPDGKQVIAVTSAGGIQAGTGSAQIQVVLNWQEELKQRVPTK